MAPTNTTSHPSPFPATIAIIGASLTGLSLALSLLQSQLFQPPQITIYERRTAPAPQFSPANLPLNSPTSDPEHNHPSASLNPSGLDPSGLDPSTTASGVVLTPNGLSVLSALQILPRIAPRCWTSAYRTYRNDADELVRKVQVSGEEVYGYRNHRCWRGLLVGEMLEMAREAGVVVRWGWRFSGVEEGGGGAGVRFVVERVGDAREVVSADLLVGADGIYSTVRKHLDPVAAPEYTGTTGVLAHIRWEHVAWPEVPEGEYERQCTLQGKPGALFWIPEDQEGSVVMVGKQVRVDGERSREEWDKLSRNKEYLCGFYRQDYGEWGSTGRKIIDAVCRNRDTLYLWPFMRMAKLERWFSHQGNVIIMGDAAHALPPSSGQGVNQTLEDVYVLTRVLELVKTGRKDLQEGLRWWQEKRQQRIDQVFDWATNATNVQRLPQAEREKLLKEGGAKSQQETDDMRWLYKPGWDEVMATWVAN
ncbi:uncharacterized protein HMPREF1541_11042 [Cyphellophora europaea CBS 101466]|uniref:FAD-binding domain-containing protein n=1 Tax=Cyphellophora europaea (strain CBS 101466) TaxID=1220924 RepID=W2S5E3_CYPE1|nr:uncharacterized protein HMPREF1541_11042 [Cyphellophora europaea CBS 101466]ETN43911.1 hypothetical protein HMPREF1541_11042 [Cyphellophora europaea CBS 101466]